MDDLIAVPGEVGLGAQGHPDLVLLGQPLQQPGPVLLQNFRDPGMGRQLQPAAGEFPGLGLELPQNVRGQGPGGQRPPLAAAGPARFGDGLGQAVPEPLPGHLQDSQGGDGQHRGLGPVPAEGLYQGLVNQVPVGRLGQPEDIAGLTAFLCSSWGDYICGQEILADGGRTIFNK